MPSLLSSRVTSLQLGGETQKKTLAFVKPPPPIYPILNALSEGTLC